MFWLKQYFVSSLLFNQFISVVVDGATSASFLVSSSVSPTFLLVFMNDLHTSFSDVHSFANDSILNKSSLHS